MSLEKEQEAGVLHGSASGPSIELGQAQPK